MSDNPFRDIKPWNRVTIGGREIKSLLVALDGNELEDEWNVQRSLETNKAIAVYRGVKLIEGVVLTFEAATEAAFDDLRELWKLLAPTRANGRPPTLQIENAMLTWIGLRSINRRRWKGPYPTATNSWRVDLGVIEYSPPEPVKVGVQDPSKPWGPTVDPQIKALQQQRDALAAEAAAV